MENDGRDSLDIKKDATTLEYVPVEDPWGFSQKAEAWHKEYNKKLLRKIDLRMLPLLAYMFLMNYLDRRYDFYSSSTESVELTSSRVVISLKRNWVDSTRTSAFTALDSIQPHQSCLSATCSCSFHPILSSLGCDRLFTYRLS